MSAPVDAYYHPQQNKENLPPDVHKQTSDGDGDSDDEVCFNRKVHPSKKSVEQTFSVFVTPQKALPPPSPLPKKKVLIVEDSPESSPVTFKQPTRSYQQAATPDRLIVSKSSTNLAVSMEESSDSESPVSFKKSAVTPIAPPAFLLPATIAVATPPTRTRQEEKREVAATKVQCIFRRWVARKQLRQLREERRLVIQQKDAELRTVTMKARGEVDVRSLDERMAQLENEWLKKITSLANVSAIFEQLAEAASAKGPRTQQIEERKMKLALLKSSRMQCKAKLEETSLPRSSFAPSTPAGAPPVSLIAAPSSARAQNKKRVRWLDMESLATRL